MNLDFCRNKVHLRLTSLIYRRS